MLDWVLDQPDAGIFHVTPFAEPIYACGRLKARCELEAVVLGGGDMNEADHLVSTVVLHSRAVWMAHAMVIMARAARNLILPHQALAELVSWVGVDFDATWEMAEAFGVEDAHDDNLKNLTALMELPTHVSQYDWHAEIAAHAAAIDQRVLSTQRDPGHATYAWLQDVEKHMLGFHQDYAREDDVAPSPVVGFTATWAQFRVIDPDDVCILQLEANTMECEDLVPPELEIRFRPEALRIVDFSACGF